MQVDTITLSPKMIMDMYRGAYRTVHKRDPHIFYVGYSWYRINGELVHRVNLFMEISRLRELGQRQERATTSSLVTRLIARLRSL